MAKTGNVERRSRLFFVCLCILYRGGQKDKLRFDHMFLKCVSFMRVKMSSKQWGYWLQGGERNLVDMRVDEGLFTFLWVE